MTPKNRIINAILHKDLDRVPHATYNIYPYNGNPHSKDESYSEILEQMKSTAGTTLKVSLGREGAGLSRYSEENIERIVEGDDDNRIIITILHTPAGDLTSEYRAPKTKPGMTTTPFISTDEDMEKFMSIPYLPPSYDTSEITKLYSEVGEHGVIFAEYADPMYSIASRFDFEDFCVRCITDFDAIKKMIDWAFERSIENMKLMVKACHGIDCILHTGGPEICTPPMMSPGLFNKLVTPYLKKLIEIAHDAGFLTAIHCHGHIREVFPEFIKTGVDFLEPIEPIPQGNIDLEELMEMAAGQVCLMGHIQDQDFYTVSRGFMTTWVKKLSKIVNGRTGYIMSPTCTPFQFPCSKKYRENYLEWLRAADMFL